MGRKAAREPEKTRACFYCGEPTKVSLKAVSTPLARFPHAPRKADVVPLCEEGRVVAEKCRKLSVLGATV